MASSKIILLAAVIALIGLSSCKKDKSLQYVIDHTIGNYQNHSNYCFNSRTNQYEAQPSGGILNIIDYQGKGLIIQFRDSASNIVDLDTLIFTGDLSIQQYEFVSLINDKYFLTVDANFRQIEYYQLYAYPLGSNICKEVINK